MDYFWLRQDRRYLHTPVIKGFYQRMRRADFTVESAHKIPEKNIVYCDSEKELDYIDILDQQVFLISEKVKRVFHMYERGIAFKFFCCLNNVREEYGSYYAPIIPSVDCLAGRKLGADQKIELYQEVIGSKSIFRVVNPEKEIVIVRLDVAESLLRRGPQGVELKRIHLR